MRRMWAMSSELALGLQWSMTGRRGDKWTWIQVRDLSLQLALTLVELAMIIMTIPLWLTMPGLLFATWIAGCVAIVHGLTWALNGDSVVTCDGSGSWTMENEAEEERWIFVGGIGTSKSHLANHTLPLLARLFTHPMIGIHSRSYGIPFDLLLVALQRAMPSFQTRASRALYRELRAALLDCTLPRVAVIAHTTGSLPLVAALTRLSADIQPEKLSKLEIYTFGCAAREFAAPLGETKKPSPVVGGPRYDEPVVEERGPHIEHFAFSNDPFAKLGVLHAVNRDHEARFCGGVFVINPKHKSFAGGLKEAQECRLNDYLTALFPNSMPTADSAPGRSSILDYVMSIDRETAEKRELAAMAAYAEAKASTRKENRRRSWTGLGATVGYDIASNLKNGVMDGVVGLEMARRGCRECDGHRGREVSRLADYVRNNMGLIIEKEVVVDALGLAGNKVALK
ncbi:hypothetical protein F5X68DRAFT_224340 [Plectosphaerella plurivora]|uniref:Uncharacterized protein n=1 Tax=Plectosphaerella plurivora TaxID=936078 RepID=A0A9P9A8Q4_9PEZI|nr:hypothetical protein F5X68DRAFT_224340 [Plectosphaerella plurivora]